MMKNKCRALLPAYLKKNEDRMPCAALLHIRNIVALECPRRILKLSGPANRQEKIHKHKTDKRRYVAQWIHIDYHYRMDGHIWP